MGSALLWTLGGLLIFGATCCGEIAGEAIYRPGRYVLSVGLARAISLGLAIAGAVAWRLA